ncbi:Phosphoribosylformylglycinamidine synthase 2 [Desulfurobacterium thermolithotrophum DSM 11699]|uniref:Phosphoribosylformylglycinamidine synthase subunit PurL n=1 Tax=Desulfurobacterium thermolithotrophum (strain DSM 11699 / BSA) TaxID=868864 RepID=F0S4A0_DESTD|nr:phosphoribosylformylglycinamidine synthase subunit PurL [Desulfurobacterium thermolithotrophum]ADY73672.1 Phosphoribosylformylglycinamidine synthase 2 [Desulfurobacterium thermolithotrophum DSM 11699]
MDREIIEQHVTWEEYQKILKILGREPNLVELGIFSAMWSEHCSYKSSRPHLKKFPTKAPWVVQGPGENAGIIMVDEEKEICAAFKVESHNHPSFIEPFHGAATGVGGILRDVFTMGARPIACMDSLRFGELNDPKMKYVTKGVVSGISHYGNCVGVPTVGGEVYFDSCYQTNPLVNAFALGIVKKDKIFYARAAGVGNPVIYVGSKTGRDGIHGATMASEEFSSEEEVEKKVNVQVGDPFMEKLLIEACLEAMKKEGIVAIQDMGAAGLTSSSVEMAARGGVGVRLELDKVPTREEGMTPYEIMLSESQERMLVVCEKGKEEEIMEVFRKWNLDACIIGEVIEEPVIRLFWHGEKVAELPIKALTDEAPVYYRPFKVPKYIKENRSYDQNKIPEPKDYNQIVKELLNSPTIASKRWIYRQYDHMVQVNTVVYPGSDAAVLRVKESKKGIAISSDCNSRYCYLNPYEGGKIAVAEAARNVACSGAIPRAITDCLNFGSPEDPEIMWQFVKATDGMADACKVLETPVVSGNVSFYNETTTENGKRAVFPTPTVVCVGVLEDVEKRMTSFFKDEGDVIVLLGENIGNVSGSEYQKLIEGEFKGQGQTIDLAFEKALQKAVIEAIEKGLIKSAHDVSEGGIAINLFESAFEKELGFEVELEDDLRTDFLLFGEDQSRIVVTTSEDKLKELLPFFEKKVVPAKKIGIVTSSGRGIIRHKGKEVVNLSVKECKEIYENSLERKLLS